MGRETTRTEIDLLSFGAVPGPPFGASVAGVGDSNPAEQAPPHKTPVPDSKSGIDVTPSQTAAFGVPSGKAEGRQDPESGGGSGLGLNQDSVVAVGKPGMEDATDGQRLANMESGETPAESFSDNPESANSEFEVRKKKYTQPQKKLVLDHAVRMTFEGKNLAEVLHELRKLPEVPKSISKQTVQRWLDDYFLNELGDTKALICRERAKQIQVLYAHYHFCMEQYRKSAEPVNKVVRTSKSLSGKQAGQKVFRDVVTMEDRKTGDPRFLKEARDALKDVRLLCGMQSSDVNLVFNDNKTDNSSHVHVSGPAQILAPIIGQASDEELKQMRSILSKYDGKKPQPIEAAPAVAPSVPASSFASSV